MHAMLLALLLSISAAPPTDTVSDERADTLVVCPQGFRQALAPWLEFRRATGHRIAVISNMESAAELQTRVREEARHGALRYVVLVGDAEPTMAVDPAVRERSVPTHHVPAVVNVKFGSEPEIASDNPYADLDDDHRPELAVGRLPCDSAPELERLVQRILDYETSRDFGPWRRQVNLVAGLGGFGAIADSVMESTAKSLVRDGIPPAYSTTMTYGSWTSPYCPDPRQFQRVAMERLNEGSLFWVYIGHGQPWAVDEVHVPGGTFPILTVRDMPQLKSQHASPIACFLACYAAAFDARRDCLAEEMLRTPGGPVAVLGGSRVTMPYAMSVLGCELLRASFVERAETLGDALLSAKRRLIQCDDPGRLRQSLDKAARVLSPSGGQIDAERREHAELFNLLGDPLLRLPLPAAVSVAGPSTAMSGQKIKVTVESSVAGTATLDLVVRRDRLTFQPPRRKSYEAVRPNDFMDVYRRANDPRLATLEVALDGKPLSLEMTIPAVARGACHLRVYVMGAEGCAAGSADISIETPPATAAKP